MLICCNIAQHYTTGWREMSHPLEKRRSGLPQLQRGRAAARGYGLNLPRLPRLTRGRAAAPPPRPKMVTRQSRDHTTARTSIQRRGAPRCRPSPLKSRQAASSFLDLSLKPLACCALSQQIRGKCKAIIRVYKVSPLHLLSFICVEEDAGA